MWHNVEKKETVNYKLFWIDNIVVHIAQIHIEPSDMIMSDIHGSPASHQLINFN